MMTKNPIQKLYADRASSYQRLFVDFLGWGRELETFFRSADYLHPHSKILDAGCGTGIITRILYKLARDKGHGELKFHAFDLTQNMLEIFQQWIAEQAAENIEVQQADVLEIDSLPSHWKGYDLIITSTMLEYLPKDKVRSALYNLKELLGSKGTLLVIMTKRNFITRWLAEKSWKTNLYKESEIQTFFEDAGFDKIEFKGFPPRWSNFIMAIEAKS
jgi:2-polyprenyl-3-methyl-5-hydroxy-6-metoxy-1,4-benzoquinol methylase